MADPNNTEECANAILRAANDSLQRKELIQKGYEIAKRLSWDESAKRLFGIIEAN